MSIMIRARDVQDYFLKQADKIFLNKFLHKIILCFYNQNKKSVQITLISFLFYDLKFKFMNFLINEFQLSCRDGIILCSFLY